MKMNWDVIRNLVLAAVIAAFGMTAVFASGGGGNGGGGNGGGGTTTGTNPLPTAPPSPDYVYRDSFGLGPDIMRPASGKGALKTTYLHTAIRSFWLEWPGNKNNQWLAPDAVETWRFCGGTMNPNELYSPLQIFLGEQSNGCVASEWFEVPVTDPTALMPITAPTVPYELSMEGYPAPFSGRYIAIGMTNSSVLASNLKNNASVVLVCEPTAVVGGDLRFSLHAGGVTGPTLNSVVTGQYGFNTLKLRVDPVAKTVGANVNGIELGTFPLNVGSPRYAGFEGVGILDDFVIRKL